MKSSKVKHCAFADVANALFRQVPFYINKKTGLPGNYCKECRKTVSRNYRKNEKRSLACDRESNYPVITSTENPTLRRELILHALETVAASIERKRRKVRESEFESESGSEFQSESVFELELELKSGSKIRIGRLIYKNNLYHGTNKTRA